MTSRAAVMMASPRSWSSNPRDTLACAAATFTIPRHAMKFWESRRLEIVKFSTARCVEAPHRASCGTCFSPMESRSSRIFIAFPPIFALETRQPRKQTSPWPDKIALIRKDDYDPARLTVTET